MNNNKKGQSAADLHIAEVLERDYAFVNNRLDCVHRGRKREKGQLEKTTKRIIEGCGSGCPGGSVCDRVLLLLVCPKCRWWKEKKGEAHQGRMVLFFPNELLVWCLLSFFFFFFGAWQQQQPPFLSWSKINMKHQDFVSGMYCLFLIIKTISRYKVLRV